MFPSRSHHPQPGTHPLNAIAPTPSPDQADRKARHLRLCARLADLGMDMAETTAARFRADAAREAAAQAREDAASEEAAAAMSVNAPPEPPPAAKPQPATKPQDHALAFARLSRSVRQTIALEAHIAADHPTRPTTPHPATPRPPPDPRRAPLTNALHDATRSDPDRVHLRREAAERLNDELAADPDQAVHISDLLVTIANAAGIELDLSRIPTELLPPDDGLDDDLDDPDNPFAFLVASPRPPDST